MTAVSVVGGPAIAGLVLAAGESSRMGRDKALLPYRGRTFLETIVAKLHEAGISRVTVVLGHHADEIQRAVSLPDVEVVTNYDYLSGQTSSLQAGLRALNEPFRRQPLTPAHIPLPPFSLPSRDESTPIDAAILCLVDHPAIESATLSGLVEAFTRTVAPLVIPTHRGQRGHPVLIARLLFEPLLALRANEGANSMIRAWHSQAQFVEVEDPGILIDVDDPETYRSLGHP